MEAAVETAAVDEAAVDDRRTGVQADGGTPDREERCPGLQRTRKCE
jgi:hypothetical protein